MERARTIVVDDREYRWRHRRDAYDLLSVWIADNRPGILLTRFFRFPADPSVPQFQHDQQGWVASGVRTYNLNRPAFVAALIREALARGWDPLGRKPMTLAGFQLLRKRPDAFPHEPLANDWAELALSLLEARAAAVGRPVIAWLAERSDRAWEQIVQLPDHAPALTVAGLVEFGRSFEQRDNLDELTVWADARQAHGQPGGLALARWLTGGVLGPAEREDLRAWCALLSREP